MLESNATLSMLSQHSSYLAYWLNKYRIRKKYSWSKLAEKLQITGEQLYDLACYNRTEAIRRGIIEQHIDLGYTTILRTDLTAKFIKEITATFDDGVRMTCEFQSNLA